MALHPSSPRRERILVFGPSGAGKSRTWLDIALWIKKTGSPAKMFVLDTDAAWEAYRPLDGSLDSIVICEDLYDWDSYMPAIKRVVAKSDPARGDWLVVDMVDKAWSRAQEGYFEYMSGKDFGSFMMESAKVIAAGGGNPIGGDYGINWQAINKMYADFIDPVHRFRGHVLCAAPASEVQAAPRTGRDMVSAEIRAVFGKLGYKPQGQKDLPHLFHTVLLLQESPKGWVYTTAKERNPPDLISRPYQRGVELGSGFALKYLIGVAGWRP